MIQDSYLSETRVLRKYVLFVNFLRRRGNPKEANLRPVRSARICVQVCVRVCVLFFFLPTLIPHIYTLYYT